MNARTAAGIIGVSGTLARHAQETLLLVANWIRMSIPHRLLLLLLISCCLASACPAAPAREMVVMVTLEGISIDQLAQWDSPDFQQLLGTSAIGLMNNRTENYQSFGNNAVTISASFPAIGAIEEGAPRGFGVLSLGPAFRGSGTTFAAAGFNATEVVDGELASRVFLRNTGCVVPPAAVVQTDIATLRKMNTEQHTEITPGLLGEQLQQHGVVTAVYGNSDTGSSPSRNSVVIAMNREGWVAQGDVSARTVIRDPARPYSMRTNYAYLLQCVKAIKPGKHFVVVETGDGGRLESASLALLPEQYAALRRPFLHECGHFLAQLNAYLQRNTDRYRLLVVVTAQDYQAINENDLLTPVVLTGTGVRPGMLISDTTHRPGVITNKDLAPTVLEFFSIRPHISMQGRTIYTTAAAAPLPTLQAMNRQMVETYNARKPIVIGFIIFVAIGVLWAITAIVFHGRASRPVRAISHPGLLKPLLTALLLVPASQLVAAGLGIHSTVPSAIFLATTTLAVAYCLHRWIRDLRLIFAVVGLAVSAILCVDLLIGTPLLKMSIFSYDPIAGIRFYGLGNESCGVLIGATLLGVYALLDYVGRLNAGMMIFVALVYFAVFILIGGPNFGSDFGGMLSALPGFAFAILKAREEIPWQKMLPIVGFIGIVLFLGLMVINLVSNQSHIGHAFNQAHQEGVSVLLDYAMRKWAMNFKLIRYSIWTYGLVSLILGVAILVYRPVGIVRQTLSKHRLLNAGFMGIIVGLIVAMLTNDSGVVMATTGLPYLTAPMLLLVQAEVVAGQMPRLKANVALVKE